jgi:hypothetical protein
VVQAGVVSADPDSLFETYPAAAGGTDGRVVVAWVANPKTGPTYVGYVASSDGGLSWSTLGRLDSPKGLEASAPSVAVGNDGRFLITWLAYDRGASTQVVAAWTTDKGLKFGEVDSVTGDAPDALRGIPAAAISRQGTAIIAYSEMSMGNPILNVARMAPPGGDAGPAMWTRSSTGQGPAREPRICATRQFNDDVYITYRAAAGAVGLARSGDQGIGWTAGKVSTDQEQGALTWESAPCIAEGGELWVSYGLTSDPVNGEVQKLYSLRVVHSPNEGSLIDTRTEAKDTKVAPYVHASGLVLLDGSNVGVAYYAGAGDGDKSGAARFALSKDAGKKFGDSAVVHKPIEFTPRPDSSQWTGDRIGVTTSTKGVVIAYVDNAGADGVAHVAVAPPQKL